MSVEYSKYESGVVVFTFSKCMDTSKCLGSEEAVMKAIDDAEKVIFNLDGVDYIASSFLRLCSKASDKVKSENFSMINVTPAIKRVFKIAGLAERLNLN